MMDNVGKKTLAAAIATLLIATSIAGVGILTNWFGAEEKLGTGRMVVNVAGAGGFGENTEIYQVLIYYVDTNNNASNWIWTVGDGTFSQQVPAGYEITAVQPVVRIGDDYAADSSQAVSNTQITNFTVENSTSTIETATPADFTVISSDAYTGYYVINYKDEFLSHTISEGENVTISFSYEIYA